MYDTVSVVREAPPSHVMGRVPWQRVKRSTDPATGQFQERQILSTGGLGLTFYDSGYLQVERSLPKALTGQNVVDLRGDQVAAAVGAVDAEVRAVFQCELPSIAEWSPARVDYCQSIKLGSEEVVALQLRRLGDVQLPRKGRPVRGESGSLRWGCGAIKPKVYSKYLESRDPAALGVLRYEVGVFKRRAFAPLLGRMKGRPIALREVLTEELRAVVLDRYRAALGGFVVSEQELGDLEFLEEWMGFFKMGRGVQLLGWCLYWAATGHRTFADLEKAAKEWEWNRRSRYRALADLRRFRAYLAAKRGREEFGSEEDLARRVVVLKKYLAA